MSKPTLTEILKEHQGMDFCGQSDCLSWELEQQCEAAINAYIAEVIGEDERHDNGHRMVNEPHTDDYNRDERWVRNELRTEQRQRAGLEKKS